VTEALSELAWCRQDWGLLEQCESALRQVEETYGPLWRGLRVVRPLAQSPENVNPAADSTADSTPDSTIAPSTDPTNDLPGGPDQIDDLARQRERFYPSLQQTRIVAGRVAAYRGELRRAVANYEEAWELGLPRVSLAVDLVELLNELGETERAQRYVREVRHFLSATSSVIDRSFLDLETESVDETIHLAEALVEDMPRSESYVRLGRTLVLTALPEQRDYEQRLQRAEAAFRRAVEIEPTNTRAWAALFRYLIAVQPNPVESQAVLAALAEHRGISPLERSYVLAQLNESINNRARAAELYRESLQWAEQQAVSEERVVVLERAAQFFRRVDVELAERCCRQALELDDQAVGPRQILIELLLAKQSGDAALEAKRLSEPLKLLGIGGDSARRLQARVLLEALAWDGDADASRQRAIGLLGGLTAKTGSDALLLAELHLLGNRQAEAISEMRGLLENFTTDGAEVLRFLREFDRQLDATATLRNLAERLYQQLESLPPFDLPALDQRLMLAERHAADSTGSPPPLTASLIESFARRAIARAASDQEQFQELVRLLRHLLASGRWKDVERLVVLKPELLPRPRTAAALANALAFADTAQEPPPPVADSLDGWLNDYSDDAELLFAVANLRFMRGDNVRAIELFRRSLTVRPHEATTLNNLALALASEDPASLNESFRLIDQAIQLDGRTAQSLDSLAVLHLIHGERDTAVTLLLEAVSQAPADGLLFLHLAKGWLEQGNEEMARFALNMAESMNTRDQALLPLDQQMYQQLVSQLGVPGR
jgi:Flp pilus assembly protein TadD